MQFLSELKSERGGANSETLDEEGLPDCVCVSCLKLSPLSASTNHCVLTYGRTGSFAPTRLCS